MAASLVMDDGKSSKLLRTSAKERVLAIDSVSESAVNSVVVMGEEGSSRGGLDANCLASGSKDGSILVALSRMGATVENSGFFVMVAVVQGRKEG
eukprot:11074166-Ditylum_brightwellii.AAC.1